jgi:hypothetical protein
MSYQATKKIWMNLKCMVGWEKPIWTHV